mgnify:CR=1 FL=1
MIVAVVAIGVVQMAVDEIIGVIAVGNGGMAAVSAVFVVGRMLVRAMTGGADGGIGVADGERVFVNVRAVDVVKMAVVEIVHVTVVFDGDMATIRTVTVGVGRVFRAMVVSVAGGILFGTGNAINDCKREKWNEFFHDD